MNELISIVMPVYNAERYLRKSIDSIICQSYKNWELIIVNDGSTDNSESIVYEYTTKYKNIKHYTIKNSGFAKYPRDMAIANSEGNYIATLDADDYWDPEYLQKMWNRLNETNADIVFPKMVFFKENSEDITGSLPLNTFDTEKIYIGKELIKYTLNGWKIGCNGGLYKKQIMNNLSYPKESYNKEILMNSDEYDTRLYLLNSKIVAFSNVNYYYCINEESVSRKISVKQFHILKTNAMLCDLIINNFTKNTTEYKLIQEQIYKNIISHITLYISHKNYFTTEEQQTIYRSLKSIFSYIDKDCILHKSIKRVILSSNFNVLYFALRLKHLCKKVNHIKVF